MTEEIKAGKRLPNFSVILLTVALSGVSAVVLADPPLVIAPTELNELLDNTESQLTVKKPENLPELIYVVGREAKTDEKLKSRVVFETKFLELSLGKVISQKEQVFAEISDLDLVRMMLGLAWLDYDPGNEFMKAWFSKAESRLEHFNPPTSLKHRMGISGTQHSTYRVILEPLVRSSPRSGKEHKGALGNPGIFEWCLGPFSHGLHEQVVV